jgi:hypothetical protein
MVCALCVGLRGEAAWIARRVGATRTVPLPGGMLVRVECGVPFVCLRSTARRLECVRSVCSQS